MKFCVRSTSGGTCTATALEEISAAMEVGHRDAVARAQAGKAGLVMSRFPTRQVNTFCYLCILMIYYACSKNAIETYGYNVTETND